MARSKKGNHNSYKSSDSINQIDWQRKNTYHKIFSYYQSLITLRKAHPAFRMTSANEIRSHLIFSSDYKPGVASYVLINHANGDEWRTVLLVFNGNRTEIKFKLMPHINWRVVAHDEIIDTNSNRFVEGTEIMVLGISMLMLVED